MGKSAEYTYHLFDYKKEGYLNIRFLLIEDVGDHTINLSVTNDIQNVVLNICEKEIENPESIVIMYRDTMGYWDGYVFKTDSFFSLLGSKLEEQAIEVYIKMYGENYQI